LGAFSVPVFEMTFPVARITQGLSE
jgi:hypothetical protein